MDDKQTKTWNECEALLTACKLVGVHAVGMQSRLNLDMPVVVDMQLIEADLDDIMSCVKRLRRAVDEG